MSRSFLTNINLNQNQIIAGVAQNASAAPSSPAAGQFYFDTVLLAAYVYNGTTWQPADASKSTIIPAAAITNLAATVQAYHLNQFAAPTAAVAMGGYQITGLATAQTLSGQAASWDFVTGRNLNTIAGAAATTANWSNAGFKIQSLGTPSIAGDAAEFNWVKSLSLSTFAVPTAALPMGGFKLTGLPTPSTAGDSAEYSWVIGQVQSAAAGIASKPPVACIATTNQALTGLVTIDGYTTLSGDRVLCTGQTTTTANGVYNAASGAWTRVTDDGAAPGEMEPGAMWLAVNGTTYGGSQWRCSNTGTITIGTTAITVVQFGAASVYAAGNGITLTGTTFAANVVASGGVLVGSSGLSVDTTVVARKFATAVGDGSTTAIVVTHGLGTQDIIMMVRLATTPYSAVECDMAATSTTTSTFTFNVAPTTGQYRVMIVG